MHQEVMKLTPDELNRRISAVFEHVKKADKILVINTGTGDPNFLYLTGFTSGLFEYSYIIVEKSGVTLFTSDLEYETAVAQSAGLMKVVKMDPEGKYREQAKSLLTGSMLGINGSFVPYALVSSIKKRYKPKKIVDESDAFDQARLIKSEEEIVQIKRAVHITKVAMLIVQKEFKEGITEMELAAKFDTISAQGGSEGPSFKTIVCFGHNASQPHHSPDNTKLKYGDYVLIDAGAKVQNYCSDLTRTFIFGDDKSQISDYEKKESIMRIVKDAQVKAFRKIKPGVKGSLIHNTAQKVIDEAAGGAYKGTFIHSLGHSLGIEVHDGAGFSPNAKQKLKPGMIITVEPGIYINGFGGVRIEDDILVTQTGLEVL